MTKQTTAPAEIENALTAEQTPRPNPISDKVIKGRERAMAKAAGEPIPPTVNTDAPLSPNSEGKLTSEKIAELANIQTEAKEEPIPESKAEVKIEVPKSEKGSDDKKPWKRERIVPDSSKPTEVVKIPLEVEEELNKLRSIVNKTSVKQLLKIEQDGKDVESYYMERAQKDPSKLTTEQLFKGFLEDEGKHGEELDELMEDFMSRSQIDQLSLTSERRKLLIKEWKNKEKDSLKDFDPADTTEEVAYRKAQTEFVGEVDSFVDSLKGQVHPEFGIKVDEKIISGLKDAFKSGITIRDNGTPDPQEFANREFLWTNRDVIFENIWQVAQASALEKKMEEDTVSSRKPTPLAATQYQTDPYAPMSGKERYEKSLKPTLNKSAGKNNE